MLELRVRGDYLGGIFFVIGVIAERSPLFPKAFCILYIFDHRIDPLKNVFWLLLEKKRYFNDY